MESRQQMARLARAVSAAALAVEGWAHRPLPPAELVRRHNMLESRVHALREMVQNAPQMKASTRGVGRWIPAPHPPSPGVAVLVQVEDEELSEQPLLELGEVRRDGRWYVCGGKRPAPITHWQPLPPPARQPRLAEHEEGEDR